MKNYLKIAAGLLLAAVLPLTLFGCGTETAIEKTGTSGDGTPAEGSADKVVCEMKIKDYGTVTLTLDRSAAPITVDHFVKLANDKSYDGAVFTRMQAGFVLQGGQGAKDNSTIKGEFASNGVNNPIEHKKGVISMARATAPDSASNQFFIVLDDAAQSSLDGSYAGFGEVTGGWDVIEKICAGIKSADFSEDYYGQVMGFLKESSYITIESVRVVK